MHVLVTQIVQAVVGKMTQQIVQVPLAWFGVVFRAEPNQAFLRYKRCQGLLETCHHYVDPKVELFTVQ